MIGVIIAAFGEQGGRMAEIGTLRPGFDEKPWLRGYPNNIDWNFEVVPAPLDTLLAATAEAHPDLPCIDFLGKSWTYRQVASLVARAAAGFQQLGVERGTRVGLLLPNSPYFVISFFAVLKAGGTVVNFNPLYAPREIEHQVADAGVEIMVTLDLETLLPKLDGMIRRTSLKRIVVARMADILPFPKSLLYPWIKRRDIARVADREGVVWFSDLLRNGAGFAPVAIDPGRDIAVLQYTGGTTGVSRGAAHTHASLWSNAEQLRLWHPEAVPGEQRILGVLPLFHVFAMTVVLIHGVRMAAELILVPRFELVQLLGIIARRRPTMMPGVPTMYAAIRNHDGLEKFDLSSLDLCFSGGAALPREVKEGFEKLTGCTVVEGYGLTEAPVVTCNPIMGRHKPGSIGLPLPGTTIEIVALDDRATVLPPGQTGEICVRGPQVMAGYAGNLRASADALMGGRLHTGDVGYMDPDGYCFIVDRLKDVILCGGFSVYPRMVEEAIYEHPAVAEVAVCGVPDDYRGETVKAFIVRREGQDLSPSELVAFLRERLSPIEVPKLFEFRDSLPKSAVGKILKRQLVREHQGATGAA